jgi:trehalose 2-sulfotransferase
MGKNYIIATTPRTGSFLLCEGLNATRIAGRPQEYGARDDTGTWRDFCGCSTHAEYFFRFPDLCRSGNGVFGAKMMWIQFVCWGRDARLYMRSGKSTPDLLQTVVGPVQMVRLVRRDTVRQAVSWLRAQATGVWSKRENDSSGTVEGPAYDSASLRRAVQMLERQSQNWDAALSLVDVPVLTIAYEDLAASYRETVARVLDFLELPWSGALPEPVLQRQADAVTEEWVRRAQEGEGRSRLA